MSGELLDAHDQLVPSLSVTKQISTRWPGRAKTAKHPEKPYRFSGRPGMTDEAHAICSFAVFGDQQHLFELVALLHCSEGANGEHYGCRQELVVAVRHLVAEQTPHRLIISKQHNNDKAHAYSLKQTPRTDKDLLSACNSIEA